MTRRTNDKKKSLLTPCKCTDNRRQIELLKSSYLVRNKAQSNTHTTLLDKNISPKACLAFEIVGEVGFFDFYKKLFCFRNKQLFHNAVHIFFGQSWFF